VGEGVEVLVAVVAQKDLLHPGQGGVRAVLALDLSQPPRDM